MAYCSRPCSCVARKLREHVESGDRARVDPNFWTCGVIFYDRRLGGRFDCLKNFPKTQVIVSVAAAGSPMAGLAASYAAASAP